VEFVEASTEPIIAPSVPKSEPVIPALKVSSKLMTIVAESQSELERDTSHSLTGILVQVEAAGVV
jgi:hypothetical protein